MATSIPGNILYYSLPNGTVTPILDVNGNYVPASVYPKAVPVNLRVTLELIPGAPAASIVQAAPQQQQAIAQPQTGPAYVLMFLQKDGTYGLNPVA